MIDLLLIETFYEEYYNWCSNLWAGEFYVEWLNKEEFIERIKTYDDLIKLQKSVGLVKDDSDKF